MSGVESSSHQCTMSLPSGKWSVRYSAVLRVHCSLSPPACHPQLAGGRPGTDRSHSRGCRPRLPQLLQPAPHLLHLPRPLPGLLLGPRGRLPGLHSTSQLTARWKRQTVQWDDIVLMCPGRCTTTAPTLRTSPASPACARWGRCTTNSTSPVTGGSTWTAAL